MTDNNEHLPWHELKSVELLERTLREMQELYQLVTQLTIDDFDLNADLDVDERQCRQWRQVSRLLWEAGCDASPLDRLCSFPRVRRADELQRACRRLKKTIKTIPQAIAYFVSCREELAQRAKETSNKSSLSCIPNDNNTTKVQPYNIVAPLITLKVGSWYMTRDGKSILRITRRDPDIAEPFPFRDVFDQCYSVHGRTDSGDSCWDLVYKVKIKLAKAHKSKRA